MDDSCLQLATLGLDNIHFHCKFSLNQVAACGSGKIFPEQLTQYIYPFQNQPSTYNYSHYWVAFLFLTSHVAITSI